ncbi:hypothetical protein ACHAXS_012378 [Conticribra weissflogii]
MTNLTLSYCTPRLVVCMVRDCRRRHRVEEWKVDEDLQQRAVEDSDNSLPPTAFSDEDREGILKTGLFFGGSC